MSSDADARRIAAGPSPADLVSAQQGTRRVSEPQAGAAPPYDPLHLCIFATIALIGWLAGPGALVVFAAVGFAGYWRAWRGGLTRSKCWLRDTRLVLTYLAVLFAAGAWGVHALLAPLIAV
jgi:hypothetical protein